MRAIIIEEDRFVELAELLKFHAERIGQESNTPDRLGWDRQIWASAVSEAHRQLHYHFVGWAQSHGARCTR
jgi:hypothetical protein